MYNFPFGLYEGASLIEINFPVTLSGTPGLKKTYGIGATRVAIVRRKKKNFAAKGQRYRSGEIELNIALLIFQ